MKIPASLSSQDIISRINSKNNQHNNTSDFNRIKDAICIESEKNAPYPESLTIRELGKMAKYVNNTYIHYSGNCALLSACLHYNIHHRQDILSAKNTSSPTVGLDSSIVDKIIFGKELKASYSFRSIDEVKEEILKRHNINREHSFIISAENYIVPIIGECGHDFNAVVICELNQNPRIQFIDAWKTSNTLPTFDELKNHFPSSAKFYIRSYNEKHD